MPDNLPPARAPFFLLPEQAVIALQGPEALAFAQAQFANDCVQLAAGQWQWNSWLSPKGRVIAVFALLKLDPQRLLLVLADGDAEALATQLQRYIFRRKLQLCARPDLQVSGSFGAPLQALNAQIGGGEDAWELDFGSPGQPRTLRLGGADPITSDSHQVAAWLAYDLSHGLPRLPLEQREQWTAHQLSLQRLPAFSVKKGCYPGQEIVARTHFLGKAKRGLVLLGSDTAVAVDSEVGDGQRGLGKVVSASSEGPALALAVLPLEREAGPLFAGTIAVHELPLAEGLQR